MSVVIVLRVEYSEALDPHQIDVELTLDVESKNVKAAGQFTTGHTPGQVRGTPSFGPIALPFNNLVFEVAGRYEWVIRVGDQELRRLPVEVVQGAMPGMVMAMPSQAHPA